MKGSLDRQKDIIPSERFFLMSPVLTYKKTFTVLRATSEDFEMFLLRTVHMSLPFKEAINIQRSECYCVFIIPIILCPNSMSFFRLKTNDCETCYWT